MKVYTVQSDNFLDNIDSEGYIDNETDKEYSIFDYKNTIEALNWMTKKYEEKISSKIDKEMIWVWNNLRDSNFPTQENHLFRSFSVFGKVYFFAIFILLSILILSSNWIFFIYFTNDYNYYVKKYN